jgi:Uma2 family endonuclease
VTIGAATGSIDAVPHESNTQATSDSVTLCSPLAWNWPDDGNAYEVLDGRLVVTPPLSETHQGVAGAIFAALRGVAPPGWRVRYDIGVRLPDGNVEPDITVLQPNAPRGRVWNDAEHVALVVEIASPSTARYDAGDKAVAYACAGIPWYWRIMPGTGGAVEVHGLSGIGEYSHHATVTRGETHTLNEPFPIKVCADDWLDPDN